MILQTVADLRAVARGWRAAGEVIGVVPTMGALHDGHLSLARRARAECDRVITTIFVNPKQFNNPDDLKKYPRTLEADAGLLGTVPVDAVFAPPVEEVYPEGFITTVSMQGVAQPLEGYMRPGHFDGVATVVAKLLNQAQPDVAVFGEKDFQQLQLIRRLALDLDIPVEIIGAPIARDADGLALSSRNAYLSAAERPIAGMMNKVLADAAARLRAGDSVEKVEATGRAALERHGFERVDYFEVRQVEDLSPADGPPYEGRVRIFAAAHLGKTRLIDNMAV